MKKLLSILMFLLVLNLVSAQVAIKEVTSQPDKVQPGERITLSILLENVENKDIENVAVKLDLTNLPFAPLESSTEKVLDQIDNEDTRLVVFNLITLPEAEPKIYKIPVKITYGNVSKDTIISINVEAKPKLDLVLEDSQVVKVNDNGKVTVKLVNLGLTNVKSLRLTLLPNPDYEILSTNTIYISNVDVEDFETAEFTIIPNQRNPKLLFNLNYKDTNNEEYAENKQIQLNVYNLDEAKKLGLVQNNIFLTILIPVIALILIYIAYRKFRKRKI